MVTQWIFRSCQNALAMSKWLHFASNMTFTHVDMIKCYITSHNQNGILHLCVPSTDCRIGVRMVASLGWFDHSVLPQAAADCQTDHQQIKAKSTLWPDFHWLRSQVHTQHMYCIYGYPFTILWLNPFGWKGILCQASVQEKNKCFITVPPSAGTVAASQQGVDNQLCHRSK